MTFEKKCFHPFLTAVYTVFKVNLSVHLYL